MIQDNETDRYALVQQVNQRPEEPLPLPVADCDRLRAVDGQFDDETAVMDEVGDASRNNHQQSGFLLLFFLFFRPSCHLCGMCLP